MRHSFEYAVVNVGSGARSMDRVVVVEHAGGLAVALADGAGGMAGGHPAADALIAALDGAEVTAWMDTEGFAAAAWLDALDRRIARSPHGGQCTAVLLGVVHGRIAGASVGDSGAWCGDRGSMHDLTREQRRKPLVGSGGAAAVAFSTAVEGGRVLIASDGLFHYASSDAIWEVAMSGTLEEAVTQLVELVRPPGGSLCDDVSIALLSCMERHVP